MVPRLFRGRRAACSCGTLPAQLHWLQAICPAQSQGQERQRELQKTGRKRAKYSCIDQTQYTFVNLAIETMGAIGPGTARCRIMSMKSSIALHSQRSVDYTVYDVKWIPSSASFMSAGTKADGTGVLEVFQLIKNEDGKRDIKRISHVSRPSGVRSISFSASGYLTKQVSLADFSGRLSVIDLEHLQNNPDGDVFNAKAHDGMINCMDGVGGLGIGEGACEIATGGEDGAVRVWDLRQQSKAVMVFRPKNNVKIDCWAVAFGGAYTPDDRYICSGYENGDVKLFDMRKGCLCWEKNLRNGICSIEFDRKDINLNRIAIGCLQSRLAIVNLKNNVRGGGGDKVDFAIRKSKVDKSSTIWCVKHLPQNRNILSTCSGSGLLSIWKYGLNNEISEVGNALLSTQPLNCVDWNRDMIGLGCLGAFDQSVRVVVATKLNLI